MKKSVIFTLALLFSVPLGSMANDHEIPRSENPERKIVARDDRFISYDNGTVIDATTGLMWAAKDDGSGLLEHKAKCFIRNFRVGGYTDWRIPTMDELETIYDPVTTNEQGYHVTDHIAISGEWVWGMEAWGFLSAFSFTWGCTVDEVVTTHSAWSFRKPSLGYRVLPVRGPD